MLVRLKYILGNKAIGYVISRYFTYFIQFVNSILLAIYLGPYYLGIWGFLTLIINYAGQLNFGIPYSVNNIVSIHKQQEEYCYKIIGNGIFLTLVLSLLTIAFWGITHLLSIEIGERYKFSQFIVPVTIVVCFTHFNNLLSNVFRIYGKIFAIAFNQSLFPFLLLLTIIFFRENNLLWASVFINCIAVILSFTLFIIQMPFKAKVLLNKNIVQSILKKGWHLFVYTASFYLILLTTKSFVSSNYEVAEFGLFTFSFSLASAILLLLNSISYLILPKMLNKFANSDDEYIKSLLRNVRAAYISLSHVLIHFVIMIFPLIIYFFPAYRESPMVFRLIALTLALYTNSFGYQILITAKEREKDLASIGLVCLVFNVLLLILFVIVLKVSFEYAITATLITYFYYNLIIGYFGRKLLHLNISFTNIFNDIYPIGLIVPFTLSIILNTLKLPNIFFAVPFVLYIVLNKKDLIKIKDIAIKIIKNDSFINI